METLTYIRSSDLTKEPKLFNGEENVFLTKVLERDKHRKNEPCPLSFSSYYAQKWSLNASTTEL